MPRSSIEFLVVGHGVAVIEGDHSIIARLAN